MTAPSFVAAEIPHGRSGSTRKGEGMWQLLTREFIASNLACAKVEIGERNYLQVYASLAHAIKSLGLQDFVRVVRRFGEQSVYIQLIVGEDTVVRGRLSADNGGQS